MAVSGERSTEESLGLIIEMQESGDRRHVIKENLSLVAGPFST
jgi:hypothetical protein